MIKKKVSAITDFSVLIRSSFRQRLVSNVNAYRDSSVTRHTIRDRLSGSLDDDGVRMEKLRLSLLCPVIL